MLIESQPAVGTQIVSKQSERFLTPMCAYSIMPTALRILWRGSLLVSIRASYVYCVTH